MKAGWQTATLGEACQFINGLWKGEEPPFVHVGVIRNTNFAKDGTLDDTDIAYLDVEAKKFSKRRLQFGDIILEKSGGGPKQPVGRVVLFDKAQGDFSFSNFTSAIRVNQPATLDPTYLHRYLHWVYLSGRTEAMQSHSTGIRNLNGDAYKAITVAFPPIAEQRRIVAILDEAFEGIATAKAHAERNLRNAREVFDDYLASVFSDHDVGWESAPIEQHVRFIDYRGRTPEKTSEGVRLITAKNVKRGFVQREPMEFVAPDSYDEWMTRGIPKVGDVLFTTEAPLGHVAQLDTDERVVFAQRVIIMQADSKVLDSTFFKYLLLSAPVQAKIHAQATGATAQGIKASLLKRIEIPFPSDVAEQRLIASRLDVLAEDSSQLEDLYQRKRAALDELKQSLLHQAFSGQL